MSNPLVELVTRYTDAQAGQSPYPTAVAGLTLLRSDHERHIATHTIIKPALCVVVQGAKWTTFGERRFDYRPGQALVVSVEMPAFSRITEASPRAPYLGVVLEFDLAVMAEVLEGLDTPPSTSNELHHGVFLADFNGPLAECVLRMVRLLETPQAIPMLSPLIMREICYWLLTGPQAGEVAKMVMASSHTQRVIRAIHALRDHFTETMRIEELAAIAQLSPSAFHRQFKALTSMTPLQYQKQLRLLEARHLLLEGAANAETAGFQVGYKSPSQFSREYTRMFGAPPWRDIAGLRAASG